MKQLNTEKSNTSKPKRPSGNHFGWRFSFFSLFIIVITGIAFCKRENELRQEHQQQEQHLPTENQEQHED